MLRIMNPSATKPEKEHRPRRRLRNADGELGKGVPLCASLPIGSALCLLSQDRPYRRRRCSYYLLSKTQYRGCPSVYREGNATARRQMRRLRSRYRQTINNAGDIGHGVGRTCSSREKLPVAVVCSIGEAKVEQCGAAVPRKQAAAMLAMARDRRAVCS
jgi:hypothetical protein